jgi:hypothetical protein
MTRPAFILVAFFAVWVGLPSCKKCTVCTVKDSNGNIVVNAEESCGSNADIEAAKAKARDKAALLSGTYSCEKP